MFCGTVPRIFAQNKKTSELSPRIQASNYNLSVTLSPESHEFKATASIQFIALEPVPNLVFALNENIYVQIESIRRLRNQVIHGIQFQSEEQLMDAGKLLEKILINISHTISNELKPIVNEAINKIT